MGVNGCVAVTIPEELLQEDVFHQHTLDVNGSEEETAVETPSNIEEEKVREGTSESEREEEVENREEASTRNVQQLQFEDGEMNYGDRLLDDLMNTFCDRLQNLCPTKIEALWAIQIVFVDPTQVAQLVTGKEMALQILYDDTRSHYVAVHYDPKHNIVSLYDSLVDMSRGKDVLTEPVLRQILDLFGHLYEDGHVILEIAADYDAQRENWSCGYRAIGCIFDLARGRNPRDTHYSRRQIYNLMYHVLYEESVSWDTIETRVIGIHRERQDNRFPTILVKRPDRWIALRESTSRDSSASRESDVTSGREERKGAGSSLREEDICRRESCSCSSSSSSYSSVYISFTVSKDVRRSRHAETPFTRSSSSDSKSDSLVFFDYSEDDDVIDLPPSYETETSDDGEELDEGIGAGEI